MKGAAASLLLFALALATPTHAQSVRVAVAANFAGVAETLAPLFRAETGYEAVYSFGPTGLLYTQAVQGAPFEILLAADDDRPSRAVDEGIGVPGTVLTYAVGELALFSATIDLADGEAVLRSGAFHHLAIADPETAPYGRAAIEALDALGLTTALASKLVTGESVTQALQFVESGNAELGFVAASQALGKEEVWIVPGNLHEPIRQDAVLLKTGQDNPAAVAFLHFLRSASAVEVIKAAGYQVE